MTQEVWKWVEKIKQSKPILGSGIKKLQIDEDNYIIALDADCGRGGPHHYITSTYDGWYIYVKKPL